ncbi:MAG TPA: 50S ribosomal protein L16 [Candidatus Marinimicrobia bacterium]|nr:50S ribosomal protein L16 [Candidatus Neomarinimicrobiota bacterium]
MTLEPKKVKWRRQHRGRRRGIATKGSHVAFGSFGMKAVEPGWVTARQIESARVAIIRQIRKHGRMWIRVFPDKPITKKPAEVRMGKGKGAPDQWVAVVKPGRILFEVEGVDKDLAAEAFRIAGHKLPVRTKLAERRELTG